MHTHTHTHLLIISGSIWTFQSDLFKFNSVLNSLPLPPLPPSSPPFPSLQADGKVVDGSLLGDANGVEPAPGRVKDSGKWQKPRFSRRALMKCCLVKWIIASTQPQDKGERSDMSISGWVWHVGWKHKEFELINGFDTWIPKSLQTELVSWPQGQVPRDNLKSYAHLSKTSTPSVTINIVHKPECPLQRLLCTAFYLSIDFVFERKTDAQRSQPQNCIDNNNNKKHR